MTRPTNLSDKAISNKNFTNQKAATPERISLPSRCCEGATALIDKQGNISSLQSASQRRVVERRESTDKEKEITKKFLSSRQ